MHERDLCNFSFLVYRWMHEAFVEDVRHEVDLANITGDAGRAHGREMDGKPGECQEHGKGGRGGALKRTTDWEEGRLEAPPQPSGGFNELVEIRSHPDPPPAGGAMNTCINDLLPEMTIRLAVIGR